VLKKHLWFDRLFSGTNCEHWQLGNLATYWHFWVIYFLQMKYVLLLIIFLLAADEVISARSGKDPELVSSCDLENYCNCHHLDTSKHQRMNTSPHQHITTSTHQHINTSTHQHINTSTHQHINTSTHQHINTSTHQHNHTLNVLWLHPKSVCVCVCSRNQHITPVNIIIKSTTY